MDPILTLVLGLLLGLVVGAIIGLLLARSRRTGSNPELDVHKMRAEHELALRDLREQERAVLHELEVEHARVVSAAAGLERELGETRSQFKDVLEQHKLDIRTREEREQRESKVLQALAPVKDSLASMSKTVADIEQQRTLQHGELTQQLKSNLQSEEYLRATAESLASALRNNSKRGVWGEAQLRRLVEAAGLMEHVDFTEQHSVKSDVGAGRIDMVVQLSDGKSLAIDAKVPFESFLLANEIPLTAVGAEADARARHLSDHAKALRAHVDALAKREYWSGLPSSPDLVIGFIPSESLLAAALETDPGVLDYAFRKNVALASPVSLWAVLKTVAYSWRQEAISKDAKRIFDLSTELFDRLRVLADHAESLRRSIESTVSNYNKFASSLETRVLVTARKINDSPDPSREIGELKGIDSDPKAITSAYLTDDGSSESTP